MKKHAATKTPKVTVSGRQFLQAAPYANEAVTISRYRDGGMLVRIPVNRPKWLVPPISWILPFSSCRQVRLDAIGAAVLELCNGRNKVETIIEQFANSNKLSFREAQVPVAQFLQQMTERGIVAVVGSKDKAREQ